MTGDATTVKQAIEQQAAANPDAGLYRFMDHRFTRGAVNRWANRLAHGFADMGVGKGDKVATLLPNRPEFLPTWFAAAKLGAVLVPLNPLLRGQALSYSVDDSQARVVVTDGMFAPAVEEVRSKLGAVEHYFVAGDAQSTPPWARPLADAESSRDSNPEADVGLADPMSILYTSGTTGMPKGVVLPHYSYINTGHEFARITGLTPDDRPFTTLPLLHVNAQQTTTMGSILAGVEFAIAPRFSAGTYWDQIREAGATIFNYIGSIIPILYKQEARADDADNPARLGIGAACPKDLWQPFEQRFGVQLLEGYGLTETGTVATCSRFDAVKVGSIGQPISFAEVQVVDELDKPLPAGQIGEIVVRPRVPYSMMQEYYRKPEATVHAWRNLWFHTGDLGLMDGDGYFYFVDRSKDCIRRRGENISSFLIQKILLGHPDVVDVAAYGVPSEFKDGEDDVKVDIVLREGAAEEPWAIIEFCRQEMAEFMVPRYIQFRPDLPKTETERVQKFKLRDEGVEAAWDRTKHEERRTTQVA